MITVPMVLDFLGSRTCQSSEDPLEAAPLIRCLDALSGVKIRKMPSLSKMVYGSTASAGELVVQCLRAYQEHQRSVPRALSAVYAWAWLKAPKLFPTILHTEKDLETAFARGKAQLAYYKAADLYADCYLVLAEHVLEWNRNQIRKVS